MGVNSTIILNYLLKQTQVAPIGSTAINVFFAVLSGLLVMNIVVITLYVFCNTSCQCCRIPSHFAWIFLCLIMILTFILGKIRILIKLIGAAVGIIGLLGTDGGGVFRYLFSEQNLLTDKVIFSGDAAIYLNTCFNSILYF
jgi:hypothetical protein